jgi:HemY protein
MIRVALFLIVVALIAFGASWLADRPGEIAITWLGYRIETSIMVAVSALIALVALSILLWSLLRALLRSPQAVRLSLRERRRRQTQHAISRGLIAIGAGDTRAAQRFAQQADRLNPADPLSLLLRAQNAQLAGDRAGAEAAFRAMAERSDTRLLGLRGLYVEAQRRNDMGNAQRYAEEAARAAPALGWAGQAVLEFRSGSGDWAGALNMLEEQRRSGALDKALYRRRRAVLLTARALHEEDRDRARATAVEATRLAPELVPAAALAGRLLADNGEVRKAAKILETAWAAHPHPDLAETYANVRVSASARERLARVENLARIKPGPEAAIAVAHAAIDASEFATARNALAPLLDQPQRRVALLMAELEELEHGDEGRAREWMARAVRATRDPAWTADGYVSDRWLPISPVTGRLDAFEWRVPLEEVAGARIEAEPTRVIEARAPEPEPEREEPREVPPEAPRETPPVIEAKPVSPAPAAAAAATAVVAGTVAATAAPSPAAANPAVAGPAAAADRRSEPEPVIPYIHVPDDPGTDPDLDEDLDVEPRSEGWQRIRQIFR